MLKKYNYKMSKDVIKTNDNQIKIKSSSDLQRKGFMEPKDNKYRIKKLISQNQKLSKPDYDIYLDELRFSKLKKYADYQLVKVTEEELKKILPNYDIKEESYLKYLGITPLEPGFYQLVVDVYTEKFIKINLKEITFEENFEIIFKMFDKDKDGSISSNEFGEMISYFNQINALKFDEEQKSVISQSIFKEINKSSSGKISKANFRIFLEKFKDEDLTINPFIRVKSNDAVVKLKKINTINVDDNQNEIKRISRTKSRNIFKKFWDLNKKAIILTIIWIASMIICGLGHRAFEGLNTNRVWASTQASRFFAGTIYFNMALLLLFMCNNFVTFLSTTKLKWFLPVEDTKKYHTICAIALAVAVIPHIILHVAVEFPGIAKICARNAKKRYVTTAWLTFWNLTGTSGCITLLIFAAMIIPAAVPYIRNKK